MRRIDVIVMALLCALVLFVSLYLLMQYDNAIDRAIDAVAQAKVSEILKDKQTLKIVCAR